MSAAFGETPASAIALLQQSRLEHRQGRVLAALQLMRKVIEIDPENSDAQKELVRRFATSEVAQDLAQSGFTLGGSHVPRLHRVSEVIDVERSRRNKSIGDETTAQRRIAIGRIFLRDSALAETIRPRKLAKTAMQQKLVTPVHSVKDAAVLAGASSGVGSSRPNTRRGSKTRLAEIE